MRSPLPVLALLAAALAGCLGPAEPSAAPLAGVVRDAATGAPVDGAQVWAEAADLAVPENHLPAVEAMRNATLTEAAPDGAFALALPPGARGLAVRAPGYLPASCAPAAPPAATACALRPHPGVLVNAHRGASAYAPENTLAALRKAWLQGADRVEFDVQLTRDLVPVLMHDTTLDRTTDGTGVVWHRTLAELRALDAGSWFHPSYAGEPVPTLDEALDLVAAWGIGAVIETKQSEAPDTDPRGVLPRLVAEALRARGLVERAVVISFEGYYDLACAAERVRCGHIESDEMDTSAYAPLLAGAAMREYHLSQDAATEAHLARVRGLGLHVAVWTVDEPPRAVDLAAIGADSITTNVPDRVLAAFAAHDGPLRAGSVSAGPRKG